MKRTAAFITAIILGTVSACTAYAETSFGTPGFESLSAAEEDLSIVLLTAAADGSVNRITGYVENVGETLWENVILEAHFLDSNQDELSYEEVTVAEGSVIEPGEQAAFEIATPFDSEIATATVNLQTASEAVTGGDYVGTELSFTDEAWAGTPHAFGGITYSKKITVSPAGNYMILTDVPGWFVVRDGETEYTNYVSKDEEDESFSAAMSLTGAFVLKDLKGTSLSVTVEDPETERHDYESLQESDFWVESSVSEASGATFVLYYDLMSRDGLESQSSMLVVDGKGSASDYVTEKPYQSDYDFTLTPTHAIMLERENDVSRFSLGSFEYDIYEDEYSSSVSADIPVTGAADDTGLLLCEVVKDQGDPEYRYCAISNGSGMLYTYDSDTTEETEYRYQFRFLGFTPAEILLDEAYVCDENVEMKVLTIAEVIEECDYYYGFEAGPDGTWFTYDTNPYDFEDHEDDTEDVELINRLLGLPESLNAKMYNTSSNDGMQSETYGNITVSWTYHPDRGLEIRYEER